jgi:hypothetical protein
MLALDIIDVKLYILMAGDLLEINQTSITSGKKRHNLKKGSK